MLKNYSIRFVPSARNDLTKMKRYILNKFKYLEYGENFDTKIAEATKIIKKIAKDRNVSKNEIYMKFI